MSEKLGSQSKYGGSRFSRACVNDVRNDAGKSGCRAFRAFRRDEVQKCNVVNRDVGPSERDISRVRFYDGGARSCMNVAGIR